MLDMVMRQDASQVRLRTLLDCMRNGAEAKEYDFSFIKSKRLHALPPATRALFESHGQGTLW